ncbi:MAG TPA: fibronectin type III domain-containing protein [Acidimicrobiales bacterium]|nr:fibronectin type III domain-containing protein [Acidimicrobiales bacterium]
MSLAHLAARAALVAVAISSSVAPIASPVTVSSAPAASAAPVAAPVVAPTADHADANLDNTHGEGTATLTARYNWPTRNFGMESVACAPAGTQRFQVLYAYPAGAANNLDRTYGTLTLRAQIQQAFKGASGNLNAEVQAKSTTVGARLRAKCLADGSDVDVTPVQLKTARASVTSLLAAQELGALGYADPTTKYVVFADFCREQPETVDNCDGGQVKGPNGVSAVANDDTPSASNPNFTSHDYAFQFCACSNGGVLTPPSYTGGTMLHEMVHTLGFVQPTAVKSTGRYHHCYQYNDLMCYADGGPNSELYASNHDCLDYRHIDCGNDDYMHPHPPAGSYLATKLNLAANYVPFIDHSSTPDITPPFRLTDLRLASAGSSSVSLQWSVPVDKRGVAGVRVYRRLGTSGSYSLVSSPAGAATGVLASGLARRTTYQFYVQPFDATGNAATSSNVVTVKTT